jgi:hypothetical protein
LNASDISELNGIRAAKYAFKAASGLVSLLIIVIIAGPIIGTLSPQYLSQQPLGIGVNLQTVQSQLQFFNSGSTIVGAHQIIVPAFNNWPMPGSVSLLLTLIVDGQVIYQTEPAAMHLAPFQSGQLYISMEVSSKLAGQLANQKIGVGGTESLSEGPFWAITVSFPQ